MRKVTKVEDQDKERRITVTLPRAIARYVKSKVDTGYFVTESDFIRFALLNYMNQSQEPTYEEFTQHAGSVLRAVESGQVTIESGDLREIVKQHGSRKPRKTGVESRGTR